MNKMIELKEFTIQERLEENIKLIERKTKLKRNTLLKITLIVIVLLIFGICDRIVSTIVGIYFPIIWTVRSMSKVNKIEWYIYWLCYSVLNFFSNHINSLPLDNNKLINIYLKRQLKIYLININ